MKFLVDNWLPLRQAGALNELLRPVHSFTHLRQKFSAPIKDEEWIRALREEGQWIVISGDYKVASNPHQRRVWQESGLTVFFLSKGWMQMPPLAQHSKLAVILSRVIAAAERAEEGTGFLVWANGKIHRIYG